MVPRYSRPEMTELWSEEKKFQLWLEIETIFLEALVKEGKAPESALENVRKKGAFSIDRVNELEAKLKHDVIAFLTNVAEHVGPDARYLHLGMTSSDLLDTTFAVQLVRSTDLILKGVGSLLEILKRRAVEFKDTVCIGRSHGIHAEPITFGLKIASWYAELKRQQERLVTARKDVAAGKISGPVGTFAHLNPSTEEYVCKKLGLEPDPVSTQIISRDRHAHLFSAFALLATTLERIVLEIRHLQRTEVREAEEFFSPGQKGSSAMPHKRNPVLSENVTGLSRLIRAWASAGLENVALWHERDISHSSVERVIAPDIAITLDFMIARVSSIMDKLVVYPEQMMKNVHLTRGLVFSATLLVELTAKGIAREEAYALIQDHAMKTWNELDLPNSASFEERVRADAGIKKLLSEQELKEIFSFDRHLAHVETIFNRVFQEG
jgi:adenylosuccinate lyase